MEEKEELQSAIRRLGIPANSPNVNLFQLKLSGKRGSVNYKGYGYFATQYIPKGTPLLAEGALFSVRPPFTDNAITTQLSQLSHGDLTQYRTLSGPIPGQNGTDIQIFRINQVQTGVVNKADNPQRIFLKASRFNHFCLPNAYMTWDGTKKPGHIIVNAILPIAKGDEIFISYLAHSVYPDRQQRQADLAHWHIVCDCDLCRNDTQHSLDTDERRHKMQILHDSIKSNQRRCIGRNRPVGQALANIMRNITGECLDLFTLCEQEGIVYPERAEALQWAANCYIDATKADNFAAAYRRECYVKAIGLERQKLDLDIVCNGHDGAEVKKTLRSLGKWRYAQEQDEDA